MGLLVLQVVLVGAAWAFCYFHSHWLAQAIAKTLLPWLIGLAIVLGVFLGAKEWLSRSEWSWIFWLETTASRAEMLLEEFSPYPFIQSLVLLFVLSILNVRYPTWKPWSKRLETTLAISAKAISVLSVFTSFTFFAAEHATIIKKASAEEKYERLKDQANARAKLIVGTRLTEDANAEAKNASGFLSILEKLLRIDMILPFPAGLRDVREAHRNENTEKWRELVRQHVNELLKAMDEAPAVERIVRKIDKERLADMVSHQFTEDQIKEENEGFKKALDIFVEKAADISIHPLFESLGLPELPESIVRELYTAEVSHLSKKITEPLADSLFRPGSVQANNAVSELTEIANRPALDVAVLPTRLVEPTMGDRAPGQVREADELARKLVDQTTN
jgi:hypothetical protein